MSQPDQIDCYDWGLGLGIGIGDWDLYLGLKIWDQDWRLGFGNEIWDWDWGLGFGTSPKFQINLTSPHLTSPQPQPELNLTST